MAKSSETHTIDLNRATADDLTSIEGIDGERARAILDYRREHGPLRSWEDLDSVPGFDGVLVGKVRNNARISQQAEQTAGERPAEPAAGDGAGALSAIGRNSPEMLIELLSERLAAERAGVRFYDAILESIESEQDQQLRRMSKRLRVHRDQEQEYKEWLEAQINALGGDPGARTAKAELVQSETQGLAEVILSKTAKLPQKLHALLGVELVENAGWQLLVELADEADDDDAKREFSMRPHHEEEHLSLVRKALEKMTLHEVLGRRAAMPTSP